MEQKDQVRQVGAVILAAGQSKRMGQPKLMLPWGKTTIINQIISVLTTEAITPILVVTGEMHDSVAVELAEKPVQLVRNMNFAVTEMIDSLRLGLDEMPESVAACLIVLGDNPQISKDVVRMLVRRYVERGSEIILPSYHQRRGHPWLLARSLWWKLNELDARGTLRDFLAGQSSKIDYVIVDTPGILADVDTPEEYRAQKPDLS